MGKGIEKAVKLTEFEFNDILVEGMKHQNRVIEAARKEFNIYMQMRSDAYRTKQSGEFRIEYCRLNNKIFFTTKKKVVGFIQNED